MSKTNPIAKARDALFNKMAVPTQKIAAALSDLLVANDIKNITTAYEVGKQVSIVIDPEKEGYFGSEAIKELAEYLNHDENFLYNCSNMTKVFPRAYVLEQSARLMTNGSTLKLSHWMQLMKIVEEKKRSKILEQVFVNSWSSHDLETEIRSGSAGVTRNARSGGRPPKAPTSLVSGLQKTYEFGNKFVRWDKTAERYVLNPLQAVAPDDVSEKLLEKAESTLVMINSVGEKAASMKDGLEAGIEHLKNVLAKRGTEPAPAAAAKAGKKGKKGKKKKNKIPRPAVTTAAAAAPASEEDELGDHAPE